MKELGLPLGFKNIPATELEDPLEGGGGVGGGGEGKTRKKKRTRGRKKVITKDLAQVYTCLKINRPKGTVSVTSSHPLCKDGIVRFTMVTLELSSDQ